MITNGKPMITINKKKFYRKPDESVFVPRGAIHRIQNNFKKPVKIIEVQTGPILKRNRYNSISRCLWKGKIIL